MPNPLAEQEGRKLDSVTRITLLTPEVVARFWRYVRRTPTCWLWTGSTTGQLDHGQFHIGRHAGRLYNEYAHRVSWMIAFGGIPSSLQVNHHCDVPTCVNPEHLYLGTQGDNVRDGIRRERYPKFRQHRKMSPAQVEECRALRTQGWELIPLADRYGVSKAYVSLLVRGLRRAHVAPRRGLRKVG